MKIQNQIPEISQLLNGWTW